MADRLYLGKTKVTPAIVKKEVVVPNYIIPRDNINGVYKNPNTVTSFSLKGATDVDHYALHRAFYNCTNLTSVDLSSLVTVSGNYAMFYCFRACTGLTSVDLSSLTTISGDNALSDCFEGCTNLITADLSSLTTISSSYGLGYCFYNCTRLTSVDLSSLTTVSGSSAMNSCFDGCTGLTSASFPSLTTVSANAFGNASYDWCFRRCAALTEFHFRADARAAIEAMKGYADKWGATNATIYFDL